MDNELQTKISIVIPVFGSEKILQEITKQIAEVMELKRWSYEIIFVCDLSPDKSWSVIQQLSKSNPVVRGILLRMNSGQHNALMAGFNVAQGQIIVTMDDDLQHSPKNIIDLVEVIENNYDVVYAKFKSRKHPLWKILGSWLNNLIASFLIGKPTKLYLSPFRAFKSSICDTILKYKGPYVYIDGLILSATQNITMVEVEHYNRYAGTSFYGFNKSISLWSKMATGFSILPLRIMTLVGGIIAGLGFLLAVLFVIQKFTLDLMPDGWSSLMVALLTISGVQLIALGVLGEYIGRILLTINARQQYIIAEQVGFKKNES